MIHPMMMMMGMAGEQSDHVCHVFSQCCIATCRCSTHHANTVVIYDRRDEGLMLRLPLSRALGQNTQQFTAKQIAVLRRRYPGSLPARRSKIACCSSHSLHACVSCVAALSSYCSRAPVQVQVCKCASAPQTSFSRPCRRPHQCTSALSRTLPPSPSRRRFFSTTPHRSPPICNPLVRRHPVASHGPARLFHYHATPIISFLFPTCTLHTQSTLARIPLAAALRL